MLKIRFEILPDFQQNIFYLICIKGAVGGTQMLMTTNSCLIEPEAHSAGGKPGLAPGS